MDDRVDGLIALFDLVLSNTRFRLDPRSMPIAFELAAGDRVQVYRLAPRPRGRLFERGGAGDVAARIRCTAEALLALLSGRGFDAGAFEVTGEHAAVRALADSLRGNTSPIGARLARGRPR